MSVIIENLSFSYGAVKALDDINISVQTGESVGIAGTSGGGKSTLLKLVGGLYDAREGRISVMGRYGSAERRSRVSMVMQNAALFPASIRDNITCGHEMPEDRIFAACEAAQLTEWIGSLPCGLETFVGERGGKVSGGQAHRIAIARAIAKDAEVVLLDEPTSALDEATGASLMAALAELTVGKTVLHVSHRPEALAVCDRVMRLEGGRVC